MNLYVLCGLPGSGKTTFSQKLKEKYNAKLYCYDEFIKKYNSSLNSNKMH